MNQPLEKEDKKYTTSRYANTFKMVRESLGMSMKEFADLHNLSKATVSLYESGNRFPNPKMFTWYLERSGEIKAESRACPYCKGEGKVEIFKLNKQNEPNT